MSFNLTVSSHSPDPVSIAIFVNPSTIVQKNHTIYTDMFPVAWKVYNFPGGNNQMPISDHYSPHYRAFVGGTNVNNMMSCSSSAVVYPRTNAFEVEMTSSSAVKLSTLEGVTSKSDLSITNLAGQIQLLGVSDAQGWPYLAVATRHSGTTEFVCLFEFAVVVVTNMKPGEVFRGDTRMPYVTFLATDVQASSIEIAFNGALLEVEGVTVTNYSSDQRPFS